MAKTTLNEHELDFLFDVLMRYTKAAQESALEIIESIPVNIPLTERQEFDIIRYHQIADMGISVLEKLSEAWESAEMQDRVLH